MKKIVKASKTVLEQPLFAVLKLYPHTVCNFKNMKGLFSAKEINFMHAALKMSKINLQLNEENNPIFFSFCTLHML